MTPADHIQHYEDLLRHTLEFSSLVKPDMKLYPDSGQVLQGSQLAIQPGSDKKNESNKESTSTVTTKEER